MKPSRWDNASVLPITPGAAAAPRASPAPPAAADAPRGSPPAAAAADAADRREPAQRSAASRYIASTPEPLVQSPRPSPATASKWNKAKILLKQPKAADRRDGPPAAAAAAAAAVGSPVGAAEPQQPPENAGPSLESTAPPAPATAPPPPALTAGSPGKRCIPISAEVLQILREDEGRARSGASARSTGRDMERALRVLQRKVRFKPEAPPAWAGCWHKVRLQLGREIMKWERDTEYGLAIWERGLAEEMILQKELAAVNAEIEAARKERDEAEKAVEAERKWKDETNHKNPQATPSILKLIDENKRLCQQLSQLGRPCGESTLDVVWAELSSYLDDFSRPRSGVSADSLGSAKSAKAKRSRGSRGALLQGGDSPSGSRGSKTAIFGESPKASAAAVRSRTNLVGAIGVPGIGADRRSKTNVAAAPAGHKPRGGTRVVRLGSLIPEVPVENAPGQTKPAGAVAAAADTEAAGNAFN